VLQTAANAIPLAAFFPVRAGPAPQLEGISPTQPAGNLAPRVGHVDLTVLDKTTGQPLGSTLAADLPVDAGAGLILDVRANPGAVQVVIGVNYLRFACPPAKP